MDPVPLTFPARLVCEALDPRWHDQGDASPWLLGPIQHQQESQVYSSVKKETSFSAKHCTIGLCASLLLCCMELGNHSLQ